MSTTRFDLWKTEREAASVVAHGIKVARSETATGRFAVKIWNPKATKPAAHYWFKSHEQREQYVSQFVQRYGEAQASKAEARAARQTTDAKAADSVDVGDIFVHQWGYDQTNVDFYEVTRKSGRNVEVRPIASREVEGSLYSHGMANNVVAVPGAFLDKTYRLQDAHGNYKKSLTKRVQSTSDGRAYLSFAYGWCEKWDGKPRYSSWYA